MKHVVILSILFILLGCGNKNNTNGLLVIKEQGSFAVGGTVIQNTGIYDGSKFDNFKPYPEGQTYHGDPTYFIKYLIIHENYHSCFFTELDNRQKLPMGVKAFKIYSYAEALVLIL